NLLLAKRVESIDTVTGCGIVSYKAGILGFSFPQALAFRISPIMGRFRLRLARVLRHGHSQEQ
ncbi:hypothetical protein, partial [Massilia brevitalea]|uniref:hypothetical protein n=1 Tax=Massilia brevitalea TaxID=442526 RepID=UPI0027398C52